MEHWASTVKATLVAAAVCWAAVSLTNLQQQGARVEEQILAMRKDMGNYDERIERLEGRVDQLRMAQGSF